MPSLVAAATIVCWRATSYSYTGSLLALHLAAPPSSAAELKLDIKLFLGLSETTYVAMLETGRERTFLPGYQIGFGPRLRKNKAFIEVLFSFNRWLYEGVNPSLGGVETQVNSFELRSLPATSRIRIRTSSCSYTAAT